MSVDDNDQEQEQGAETSFGSAPDFEDLLEYLRGTRGFDFTGYKRASLQRRVQRRMTDVGIERYQEYRDHLHGDAMEFETLFNTVLVNVTSFFRDVEAWDKLRTDVLPAALAARPTGAIRAWSAGCSSGQEACTIAICLAEALGIDEFRRRVKIYATDVDEEALRQARGASYSEREVSSLPADLLEKYFERRGSQHLFRSDLRRSVIFGRADLVHDAPVSHVDLLVCRNTLMYLTAETQAGVVDRLHHSLTPDGLLFLGKAEMVLSHGTLFAPVDLPSRLFRPVPVPRTRVSSAVGAKPSERAPRPFHDPDVSDRPVALRPAVAVDAAHAQERPALPQELGDAHRRLETAYEELESTHEELETAYEELQSTNEQLETTNAELQSTNEELETMNSELQSMNDELQISTHRLRTRTDEVAALNAYVDAVFSSLRVGVAVVDADMQLTVWNAVAADLWGVRAHEVVGADLLTLDIGLPVHEVGLDVKALLSGGIPVAGRVLTSVDRQGRWTSVKVTVAPLHGSTPLPEGAVIIMEPQ